MGLEIRAAIGEADRERARAVRKRVFVEEQGVPAALELDEHDAGCAYVLAVAEGQAVGAARHRETPLGHKLERVAVLAELRGRGIGARIVQHVLDHLPPEARPYVHAQEAAVGFWARMGFVVEGAPFLEAEIVHFKMTRSP
jgi:predicted GNAT family N-acyltransferase